MEANNNKGKPIASLMQNNTSNKLKSGEQKENIKSNNNQITTEPSVSVSLLPEQNINHKNANQSAVPSTPVKTKEGNSNQLIINLGISIGQFHPLTKKYLDKILIPALKKYNKVILFIEKSRNKDPKDIFSDTNVKEMIKKSILENNNHTDLITKLIIITIPDIEIMRSLAKSRKVRKILRKYNIEDNNINNYNPEYNWYYIFGKILKKYFFDKNITITIFGPKNESGNENLLIKYLELIKLISLKISESENNVKNNSQEFKNNGNMNLSSTVQELLHSNSVNLDKIKELLKYIPLPVLEIIYKDKPELLKLLYINTKPVNSVNLSASYEITSNTKKINNSKLLNITESANKTPNVIVSKPNLNLLNFANLPANSETNSKRKIGNFEIESTNNKLDKTPNVIVKKSNLNISNS